MVGARVGGWGRRGAAASVRPSHRHLCHVGGGVVGVALVKGAAQRVCHRGADGAAAGERRGGRACRRAAARHRGLARPLSHLLPQPLTPMTTTTTTERELLRCVAAALQHIGPCAVARIPRPRPIPAGAQSCGEREGGLVGSERSACSLCETETPAASGCRPPNSRALPCSTRQQGVGEQPRPSGAPKFAAVDMPPLLLHSLPPHLLERVALDLPLQDRCARNLLQAAGEGRRRAAQAPPTAPPAAERSVRPSASHRPPLRARPPARPSPLNTAGCAWVPPAPRSAAWCWTTRA